MVRAIDLLISRGHDVQAVIIGEGHADGPAAAEARRLGLTERVSLLEARHDLDQLVPGLDVFLLSSAWGEAFPLAVTEAMAAGVPCVVTDVGDCSTLVGEAGLVVPPGDAAAQARAVEVLIAAGVEGRSKLGRAGRARVANLYSTGNYIRLHDATYRDAATHPAKGPERSEVSA